MRFKLYEKLLLIACGLSFVSDVLLLPYSGFFCLISFTLLGASYIFGSWFLFSVHDEGNTEQNNPAFTIIGGLVLGGMALSVIYRAYRWPGHNAFFYISLILTIIIWMVSSILRSRGQLVAYYRSMLLRSALLMSLAFIIIARHHDHKRKRVHTVQTDSSSFPASYKLSNA